MHFKKKKQRSKTEEAEAAEMEKWIRGALLGRGSFGTVNLAFNLTKRDLQTPKIMAVKSAILSQSSSLEKEREVLEKLQDCPQILSCFGHDITVVNGKLFYNLFLEYASGGSLAKLGKLPESEVRRYTSAVLKGLSFMHLKGLVHCDVKLQNLLLFSPPSPEKVEKVVVKIADFGLVKRAGEEVGDGVLLRGTPVCMAPEAVAGGEYEPPADIWGVGCAVVEMITGKPAWHGVSDAVDVNGLLFRIGFSDELPVIPSELSEEGKDFLQRCFVRDPAKRWTAEMLLQHPFVGNGLVEGDGAAPELNLNSHPSPKGVFDFMTWGSLQSSVSLESVTDSEGELDPAGISSSPADRIRWLATGQPPKWSDCEEDWITSRQAEESPVSQLPEIQAADWSTSLRSDSLQVLEQMVLIDRERDVNSDSPVSQMAGIQALGCSGSLETESLKLSKEMMLSTDGKREGSSIANEMELLGLSGSDIITRFGFSRGKFASRRNTRDANVYRFGNCRMDGSGFFSLSCKNRCSNCTDSSISMGFKHRDLY
ncbi:mitogen-activated protein kinase kinase kinase 2-like protein [Cinnamomum micranthum f. kanehirae]|uniref:Mitogen-activated protein kinase kinase kinase 2-like protein n=1 Tax=Cinnamomum micranthum f. kanehirae TaxID=337451 RepID=A0A3S3NF08_9MAGN|nr:mitogen-activated protein kinase kinase kinase 2-like protein [Cinnamomum micranthum f. kanehirae]